MVGITSYGAYVPLWRLKKEAMAKGAKGEKPICNFDEDTITMSVAAAIDCLNGIDRQIVDGLYLATTTSPYKEHLGATTIALAVDLRRNIYTADFANSLRAGTSALKSAIDAVRSGSARQVLVVAADCRTGAPGSDLELRCGDAAAAILVGDASAAVELEAGYSVADEMMDIWRSDDDAYIRSWEGRFVWEEGTARVVPQAVSALLAQCNISPAEFSRVVFYGPEPRRYADLARMLKFDPKTVLQDNLSPAIGDVGVAHPLLLLITALAEAQPGDRILLASYANGCDVLAMRATDEVRRVGNGEHLKKCLESKKVLDDYHTYLGWRRILDAKALALDAPFTKKVYRYPTGDLSATSLWREREQNLRLYGSKCKVCGLIDHPPQRVCSRCYSKDQFDLIRLAEKKGKIFTYTMDYVISEVDVPMVIAVIDFDDGGRIMSLVTDREVEAVGVGMPVEMTFRKLFQSAGIHNYYWKAMPLRFG